MFEKFFEFIEEAKDKAGDVGKALILFQPEPPFRDKGMITVLVTSASLITISILGGVTLASLLILLVALSCIMLILTRILGIEFDVNPEDIFGFRP